jgi:hypothetical protein
MFAPLFGATVDLRDAVVVVRAGVLPNAEKTAATVLVEEVEKRTGVRLNTSSTWPADRPVIAITSTGSSVTKAEGYRLFVDQSKAQAAVRIMGADARGALFGVGNFLRQPRCCGDEGRRRLPDERRGGTIWTSFRPSRIPASVRSARSGARGESSRQLLADAKPELLRASLIF